MKFKLFKVIYSLLLLRIFWTHKLSSIFIVLAHWNNSLFSPLVGMSTHSDTLSRFCSYCALSGEATNTNFKIIGLNGGGFESMIYHTRDKHEKHYTTHTEIWQVIYNSKSSLNRTSLEFGIYMCLVYTG